MAVYPFYVSIDSSSRKDVVGVGCRNKRGYMNIDVCQRDQGRITTPYSIRQNTVTREDGTIVCITSVIFQGKEIHSHLTDY